MNLICLLFDLAPNHFQPISLSGEMAEENLKN